MNYFNKKSIVKYGTGLILLISYCQFIYNDITNYGEITLIEGFPSYTKTSDFWIDCTGYSIVLISFLYYLKNQKKTEKEGDE